MVSKIENQQYNLPGLGYYNVDGIIIFNQKLETDKWIKLRNGWNWKEDVKYSKLNLTRFCGCRARGAVETNRLESTKEIIEKVKQK